ncbi:MAG: lytic transglycosylase domain-containing protein [Myxococcota bacterium]
MHAHAQGVRDAGRDSAFTLNLQGTNIRVRYRASETRDQDERQAYTERLGRNAGGGSWLASLFQRPRAPSHGRVVSDSRLTMQDPGDGFWATMPPSVRRYREDIVRVAQQQGIPPGLFARLIRQESSGQQSARSERGAIGLTQLLPGTARDMGVNPFDAQENLLGGARYLRQQFERFGSWPLALAAYNAGPNRSSLAAGQIPPFSETRNYVARIWGQVEPSMLA